VSGPAPSAAADPPIALEPAASAAAPAAPPRGAGLEVGIRAGLVIAVLLAVWLRVWAVDWQLPWQFHPDEGHYVWKAVDMARDGNLNPRYFRNPSLFTYLLLFEYKLLELGDPLLAALQPSFEVLRQPSLYVFIGRLTSALLGAATVLVVFRLGATLTDSLSGLLGALLLAVALLHVRDAHFATNDVAATFLVTWSVLFSARLWRSGRDRDLLLAAFTGGLATSTKYNAGFFFVPLLAAFLLAHGRGALSARRLAGLLAGGFVALAAFLLGTPFSLLAWPTFRDDFLVQQRFARSGWEGQGPEPVSLLFLDTLVSGLGWPVLVLALIGFAWLAWRRPAAALLLGSFPLVYLLFMLGVKLFFARFATPLAPFICLAAGYAIARLGDLPAGRPARVGLLLGVLTLAALPPFWASWRHNQLLTRTDTRALAFAWLDANLPPDASIVAEDYSVRDRRPRADLPDRERFDLDQVNALSERGLEEYRRQGYRYAVLSSFQYQRFGGPADTYGELERGARRLASFEPTVDGQELPFDIEALYSPLHDLDRLARPGPTIRIYALEPRR
jgi:4-amino-4-deoxy-L-arabinose transferase-like glycosyltransferase